MVSHVQDSVFEDPLRTGGQITMTLGNLFVTTPVGTKELLQRRREHADSREVEIQQPRVELKRSLGTQLKNMGTHVLSIFRLPVGGQSHDDVLIVIRAESQKRRHGG